MPQDMSHDNSQDISQYISQDISQELLFTSLSMSNFTRYSIRPSQVKPPTLNCYNHPSKTFVSVMTMWQGETDHCSNSCACSRPECSLRYSHRSPPHSAPNTSVHIRHCCSCSSTDLEQRAPPVSRSDTVILVATRFVCAYKAIS